MDATSGIAKLCLYKSDKKYADDIADCQSSKYEYVYPNNRRSNINNGTYILYAIDNVGHIYAHKYIFKNVSNGIDFSVSRSSVGVTGGIVTLTAKINAPSGDYDTLQWYVSDTGNVNDWTPDEADTDVFSVRENGYYKLCITSIYGVEKCSDSVHVKNINKSEISDSLKLNSSHP
jgi:hypothetical protein